jgi:hypothetical protein
MPQEIARMQAGNVNVLKRILSVLLTVISVSWPPYSAVAEAMCNDAERLKRDGIKFDSLNL